jgi:putative transposon-encoded protein
MKRRSTRHVSEITTTATEFGNSAKIIVPRSWLSKSVIAFLHSEYISRPRLKLEEQKETSGVECLE